MMNGHENRNVPSAMPARNRRSIFFARVEHDSRNATQRDELMTFILTLWYVFPISGKLVALLYPCRFNETLYTESREH
jgi:hypothetical protein